MPLFYTLHKSSVFSVLTKPSKLQRKALWRLVQNAVPDHGYETKSLKVGCGRACKKAVKQNAHILRCPSLERLYECLANIDLERSTLAFVKLSLLLYLPWCCCSFCSSEYCCNGWASFDRFLNFATLIMKIISPWGQLLGLALLSRQP